MNYIVYNHSFILSVIDISEYKPENSFVPSLF